MTTYSDPKDYQNANNDNLHKCPACIGSGKVKIMVIKECPVCDGTRTVLGKLCEKCRGEKPSFEKEEYHICHACMGIGLELGVSTDLQ